MDLGYTGQKFTFEHVKLEAAMRYARGDTRKESIWMCEYGLKT